MVREKKEGKRGEGLKLPKMYAPFPAFPGIQLWAILEMEQASGERRRRKEAQPKSRAFLGRRFSKQGVPIQRGRHRADPGALIRSLPFAGPWWVDLIWTGYCHVKSWGWLALRLAVPLELSTPPHLLGGGGGLVGKTNAPTSPPPHTHNPRHEDTRWQTPPRPVAQTCAPRRRRSPTAS